ncbi:MAG: O-methyltransferase [Acidimicrobiales bacterium]
MSPRSIGLSDALQSYIDAHSSPPDEVQRRLIADTEALGSAAGMQISPEQGTLLSMLVGILRPAFAVEVGTFTGYSSLAIARALPPGGRLLCCDVSEDWTAMARAAWAEAGVDDRIALKIAPAIDTLRALPADTVVDFAFIDADKSGYTSYYEEILARLSPDGMIAVDNTLWSGAVIDDTDTSVDTVALRAFNAHVAADDRTVQVITPIGDGLTLIRRR